MIEGAITVTTNVTGAAVKVVSGTAVVATASAIASESAIKTPKVANGTYTVVVSKDGYKETTKEVTVNGDTEVSVELEKIAEPTSAKVTAIGAKKIQVALDSPAADTSKAKITIKKGAIDVNTDKVTFADDKKTALVETAAKLTKGDYEITVSGVATKDITSKLTAEDEKVAKIDVTTKTAPYYTNTSSNTVDKTKATVKYKLLNQYGEDVTSDASYNNSTDLKWSFSTGKAVTDDNKGALTVENAGTPATDFIPGTKVYLTGVYAKTGAVVNAEMTIGVEAKADQVVFKGVYNTKTKKFENLPADFENGKYVLAFDVIDQYGNKMDADYVKGIESDYSTTTATAKHTLVFTSNNPLFIGSDLKVSDTLVEVGDTEKYCAVKLTRGQLPANGGKTTIQVISNTTGKSASYEISADAASQVKTFTMSAPQQLVVEGEKAEIPFTAADQNGKAITKFSELDGKVSLTGSDGTFKFVQQNDGSAKLFYTPNENTGATDTMDKAVYLTSMVSNGSGSFSSVLVNVKKKATAKAVLGLKNVNTDVAVGNFVTIAAKNILLQDQYGRTMTEDQTKDWIGKAGNSVVIESTKADKTAFTVMAKTAADTYGNGDIASVSITTKEDNVAGSDVKITADSAATSTDTTEKLTFSLNNDKPIKGSEKTITFTKVAASEYKSYAVDDLGTLYVDPASDSDSSAKYSQEVKVYGIKEDGSKVKLPVDDYDIVLPNAKLKTADSKITEATTTAGYDGSATKDFYVDGKEVDTITVKINVNIKDKDTGSIKETITKDLVVSKAAPKLTTITFNTTGDNAVTDGKANVSGDKITATDLASFVKEVKDQYGVVDSTTDKTYTISKVQKVDGSNFTVKNNTNGTKDAEISGAKLGDKFTVTYACGAAKATVEFTVGADKTAPKEVSAKFVNATTVQITFDEDVKLSSGFDATAFSVASVKASKVEASGKVITLTGTGFTENDNVTFTATNTSKVTDLAGNALADIVSGLTAAK